MAHIKKIKRKLPASEAVRIIERSVRAVTDARIMARRESDDAGKHIVLYIERAFPDERLPSLVKDACTALQEHHWRLIPIKIPVGWIQVMEDFIGRD
jgi:hypothetical protein